MIKMEPQDKNRNISADVTVTLDKVDYTSLPREKGPFSIDTSDEIVVKDATKDGFDVIYTRRVSLSPLSHFAITLVYSLHGIFTEDSIQYYEKDPDGFQRWVEKYKENLVMDRGIPALASSLISSITLGAGITPVVVQPFLLRQKKVSVSKLVGDDNERKEVAKDGKKSSR